MVTYAPQKDAPNQVRITVGRNLFNYPYKLTTCTADMVSAKIMWNSVISTLWAKFGGANIKKHVPWNATWLIWVHATAPQTLPKWHHSTLQSPGKCTLWLRLHGDLMWRVWVATSRHLSQQAPMETPGSARLLWGTTHTWTLEAHLASRVVQSVCWRLRRQIYQQWKSQTPLLGTPNWNVWDCWRLGG